MKTPDEILERIEKLRQKRYGAFTAGQSQAMACMIRALRWVLEEELKGDE
jgi:hypothetical protein